jgi:hypothetical protein
MGTLAFDFKKTNITFRYSDLKDYDANAVIKALETVGNFKGATELKQP